MRDISYKTWIARSLARAFLADADKPGGTRMESLQARAVATLGENPVWLASVIKPLAALPTLRWQMLDVDTLTQRILNPPRPRGMAARASAEESSDDEDFEDYLEDDDLPSEAGLSFDSKDAPHIRRLILRPARMRPRRVYVGSRNSLSAPASCSCRMASRQAAWGWGGGKREFIRNDAP